MKIHEKYISRCIQLAKNGLGTTYPNPLVGSVIVYNEQIIGEGWHQKAGEPHAEVNAINSVKHENRKFLHEATIYVSLEPCSHYGKTPPCADLIINTGIKNVVIGTVDPFAEVAGRGIKKLFEAGHHVTVGILEEECMALNQRFFTYHTKKRPYIILKWAETADRYIAPVSKSIQEPVWITNTHARQLVHQWRSQEQGILVGTQTALDDNPSLTTRDWFGANPTRIVIDRNLRLPESLHLFDKKVKTIVITEQTKESDNSNLIFETIDFNKNIPSQINNILYDNKLQSVIIEGGAQTLQFFINENLWDEARVFQGAHYFGEGIKAPELSAKPVQTITIQNNQLNLYHNI